MTCGFGLMLLLGPDSSMAAQEGLPLLNGLCISLVRSFVTFPT